MKGGPMLMALLGGKPKGDESPEEEEAEASGAPEDSAIDDFVSALQDDDAAGARMAFKAAVRACMSAKESGSYDEE